MTNLQEIYGCMVFNDAAMQARLPRDIYKTFIRIVERDALLEPDVANIVANAMKEWAVEKGATHFSHWFQPMTGITAEKHDSFIYPIGGGRVIMEFSGTELARGEPDASSLPSGGLRATFEARGYTAWDPTSYAFIKGGTLYIPTAFCSYGGAALDKKTPLLRSMQAIDKHALRILRLFGNTSARRVVATVGAEQEYFLIDKEMYLRRPDLVHCGRTLFGARPPKGQEMDDHYFGAIKPRVSAFMRELEEELWKLGIPAKTKHNESAPGQHELAPIFETVNIATDHNQLTMELMKSVANRHDLACLLSEKPFAGVNGSGKHNNWSLATDKGVNLFEPGETPFDNAQFLLFLTAVIKAVDEYQDLLRVTAASAGNDHRLGVSEAPPAVISIFLGEELTEILEAIENETTYNGKDKRLMEVGVTALPRFPMDMTDRNRTSPLAFTGNKFEFRMIGSSFSIACTNYVFNTIVAEALSEFADVLEASEDFTGDLGRLIKLNIREHKRIIYNGNNYADEWEVEAHRRGLQNLRSTVDALPAFILPKNIALLEKHNVLTKAEVYSRYEILLDNYWKTVHIEALTMADLIRKWVIPASIAFQNELARLISTKRSIGSYSSTLEERLLQRLDMLSNALGDRLEVLEADIRNAQPGDNLGRARYCHDILLADMAELRHAADELETLIGDDYWKLPTYAEMLYSVNK